MSEPIDITDVVEAGLQYLKDVIEDDSKPDVKRLNATIVALAYVNNTSAPTLLQLN